MHFLVSALGSAGDVHPFIAIAQALQARGHDVRMIAAGPFEERIARAGIAVTPLGTVEEYERVVQRPEMWHPRRGSQVLLDELLARLPEAHAATAACIRAHKKTVLVGSTLSWGMRLVEEQTALPGATVHLSPFVLQSATQPPVLPGVGDLSWMPARLVRALQWAAERFVIDPRIAPRLNGLRAELGLPPVRRVLSEWMHSPDLVIGAWPAWFAPSQPDWPPQTKTTGFPLFDERGALDPGLAAFLEDGEAPIGITPGSAMAHGERFFARALDACRSLEHRAVLITPYREQLPMALPEGAYHVAWAPFGRLLPRLKALIHHGGIGTSAQALAAGIPQLVVPFAHDQFDNAARLCRLGVAASQHESAPVTQWVAALCGLLDSTEAASTARRYAARMATEERAEHVIALQLEQLGLTRV